MTSPALDRVRFFVAKLSDPRTKASDRLQCWRLMVDCAREAHEAEIQQQNELNSLKADPTTEVSVA